MLRFYQVVSISVNVSSTQSLYCTPGSEESKISLQELSSLPPSPEPVSQECLLSV